MILGPTPKKHEERDERMAMREEPSPIAGQKDKKQ
jgi:hypothetical protein